MYDKFFDMKFFVQSYRIRRHTDRNPEGATHTFGPTRCKLKMIFLQERPKCYKSLSQLKTWTLLLSSSSRS